MELILFGVVHNETPEQLYTSSLINPGEGYIIEEGVKAYILLKSIDEYHGATE